MFRSSCTRRERYVWCLYRLRSVCPCRDLLDYSVLVRRNNYVHLVHLDRFFLSHFKIFEFLLSLFYPMTYWYCQYTDNTTKYIPKYSCEYISCNVNFFPIVFLLFLLKEFHSITPMYLLFYVTICWSLSLFHLHYFDDVEMYVKTNMESYQISFVKQNSVLNKWIWFLFFSTYKLYLLIRYIRFHQINAILLCSCYVRNALALGICVYVSTRQHHGRKI